MAPAISSTFEGRGVGREESPGLGDPIELGKDPLFERHLLEHGLDHDIGIAGRVDCDGAADKAHAAVHIVGAEAAAGHRAAIIGGDPLASLLQPILAGLDQGDRDPGIGKTHRDAAAHRAGADDGGARDRPRPGAFGHSGHLRRFALGEEDMALRLRLVAGDELPEQLALAPQALVERQGKGVAHRFDASRWRLPPPQPAGERRRSLLEGPRIGANGRELVVAVAHPLQRAMFGHGPASKGDRGADQIARGDLVDDPQGQGFGGGDRVAGDDHPQRRLRSDETRQALRPAGPGQEAKLDFGQADLRRRHGDAAMAGERHLEAAAQCRAVHCRDHRFRHRLDQGDDLAEAGRLRRLAEFGDVGAGEKGAPGAGDHHGVDRRVIAHPAQRLDEACPHFVLQRIDRRIVDGDDRNPALLPQIDAGVDIAHARAPICPGPETNPAGLPDEGAE